MKILHYTFGLPPYRTGGLIDYVISLSTIQKKLGHEVTILYPGTIYKRKSRILNIKKSKRYDGIITYKIINPLPIPLTCGIRDVDWFAYDVDDRVYDGFLEKVQPDVIHIHSLMGIHKKFLEVAKKKKIRVVFTTHDYYGLCPTCMLFKNGMICENYKWNECSSCCAQAFGTLHLILDQSEIVHSVSNMKSGKVLLSILVNIKKRFLKKKETYRDDYNDYQKSSDIEAYENLRSHFIGIYKMVDYYHFNSDISKNEYMKRLGDIKGKVIPITNSRCSDNRKKREYNYNAPLKIGYLGPESEQKGYYLLKKAVEDIGLSPEKLLLNTYFDTINENCPNIIHNQPFKRDDLEKVMCQNDIICVPSLWRETFGLVVIEALSYGVPVLISSNVGASILLKDKSYGLVIENIKLENLKNAINDIVEDRSTLQGWNKNICDGSFDFTMEKHAEKIIRECYINE